MIDICAWDFLTAILLILGQGHAAIEIISEAIEILPCPRQKMRTTHAIATKLGSHFPLSSYPSRVILEQFCWTLFLPRRKEGTIDIQHKVYESKGLYIHCATSLMSFGFLRLNFGNNYI